MIAQRVEDRWVRKLDEAIRVAGVATAESVPHGGKAITPDFQDLLMQHFFDTQLEALRLAEREREIQDKIQMAAQPRTLKDLMVLYDRWRKGLFKPKSISRTADSLKKVYIAAVQAAWNAASEAFRAGDEFTQNEVRKQIREAAQTTAGRAGTIVRTETTRYYNDARKAYYDASTDVTHYLFLAIRDKATTKWCTSLTVYGMRGRSGLVYAKDDPLLKKEKPPCHWNCRSELLPLSPRNPAHRKLIEDAAIQRRNNKCHPLPPGWNS